jgi:hypothetical protein
LQQAAKNKHLSFKAFGLPDLKFRSHQDDLLHFFVVAVNSSTAQNVSFIILYC